MRCLRCGHEWYARVPRRPSQCPRCKSPAWDRSRQVAEAKVEYKAESKTKKRRSFMDMPSFGMWADLTESDDELLNRLGGGWGDPDDDYSVSD